MFGRGAKSRRQAPLGITLDESGVSDVGPNGYFEGGTLVTGTATGGAGTKTYAWTRTSGATQVGAVAPTSNATTFYSTGTTQTRSAVMRLTVTDDTGSAYAELNVDMEHSA